MRPRIAVDCMGGDGGPEVTVAAAHALRYEADFLLVGNAAAIRAAAPETGWYQLIAADRVLGSDAGLRRVLKTGAASSVGKALLLHRDGQADAVVSAGDTAVVMSLARHLLGMHQGAERPLIAREFLGRLGPFWMADLGANVHCTPEQLKTFARQTSLAAQLLSALEQPRVALLNIGTEQSKGTKNLREAARLLSGDEALTFSGFLEPNELFDNRAEVVICDGFVGNIALKSIEGTASMARHLVRQQLMQRSWPQRLALSLLWPTLRNLSASLDTDRYNGAQFLGLKGVVVKSHGSASPRAFEYALRRAMVCVGQRLLDRLEAQSI